MRIVLQRVSRASVSVEGMSKGSIDQGLLLFIGIGPEDTEDDARWLASKICTMRIFQDEAGKMNLSVKEIGGEILLISQFTLFASLKKGNRPSFNGSAKPEKAIPLYRHFHKLMEQLMDKKIQTGEFGAHMDVSLCNDGPVTITMDSKERS